MLKRLTLRFGLLAAAGLMLATAPLSRALAGDSPPISGAVSDFSRIDPPLPAPGASFRDGAGKVLHLADFRGKVVLLNVWATWCEPCRVEMPSIEKLHREFGPHGLSVVAISVDDPGAEQRIRDFVKELGLTFEVLHDPKQVTTRNYQITGYPETFLIARDGVIRKKLIGASDWSSEGNRALVRELLGGTTASR